MLVLLIALSAQATEPTCLTHYGQSACGYDCTAQYGEVGCARTPQGACHAAYGKLVCWDPPVAVRPRAPQASCIEQYGEIACGYGCAAAYGEVGCATLPGGVCEARAGGIHCYHPPSPEPRPRRWPHLVEEPEPDCLTQYGKTACGFHCVAQYGEVACARTHHGACHASYGQVVCWDPPARVPRDAAPASCQAMYGEIACGWSCAASYGQVRCADHPHGVCEAQAGQIQCWAPRR